MLLFGVPIGPLGPPTKFTTLVARAAYRQRFARKIPQQCRNVDTLLTDGFFFAILVVLIRCGKIPIFLTAALQKKSGRGSVKKSRE
jgi:hypothetical protein